ncbi:hypothetical protein ACFQ3Z_01625 [Streptomyces nogalater]
MFVELDRFPQLTSGKLDRQALPVPDFAPVAAARRAPRARSSCAGCSPR